MKHETATWATGATSGAGKNVGARSGGEDRAPTCPEAFGETRPTGETGPF